MGHTSQDEILLNRFVLQTWNTRIPYRVAYLKEHMRLWLCGQCDHGILDHVFTVDTLDKLRFDCRFVFIDRRPVNGQLNHLARTKGSYGKP